MKQLLSMVLLLLVLVVGCTSTPSSSGSPRLPTTSLTIVPAIITPLPTSVTTQQPTITSTLLPPPEPVPLNSPTSMVTSTPVQKVFSPELITICPSQQVVSFDALELHQDLRLLLLQGTVNSYPAVPSSPLIISPGDLIPQPILEDEFLTYQVSPDHKWISFERPGDDDNHLMLWISSLDGQQQWPVIPIAKNYYPVWTSENEIFIVGSPLAKELEIWDYFPFLSINPFTLEQRLLTYLAVSPAIGRYYYGSINIGGRSYAMYGRLNLVDYLYDYSQEIELPVFQWLNEIDLLGMQNIQPIWIYDENKFAVTVARSDGIDVALGLDIFWAGKEMRYPEVMKRIVLPEHLLPLFMLGIGSDEGLLALQRAGYSSPVGGPNWFYIFNYQSMEIRDYCLNLPDSVGRARFSPNGRFIALSLNDYSATSEQDKYSVVVIDLEKGTIAYLKGYTVVGWGIANDTR
jgi:hypothetical protein